MNSFPFSFMVYGGYTFDMKVRPDDEEVVFLAAMNMFRSENGFADSVQTTFMGGYPFDMDSLHALHPDQHGITFLPSDPDVLFMANDGGVYITYDCMADSADMFWYRLNNKLTTTQFYSVTIDHAGTNDDIHRRVFSLHFHHLSVQNSISMECGEPLRHLTHGSYGV